MNTHELFHFLFLFLSEVVVNQILIQTHFQKTFMKALKLTVGAELKKKQKSFFFIHDRWQIRSSVDRPESQ